MTARKTTLIFLVMFFCAGLAFPVESRAGAPKSFLKNVDPKDSKWLSIEVREKLEYAKTWDSVVDVLMKRFDLGMINKEEGYLRTAWAYNWTGQHSPYYRVRVTIKFSSGKKVVQVKPEAEYGGPNKWISGRDTGLDDAITGEITGSVGRITK